MSDAAFGLVIGLLVGFLSVLGAIEIYQYIAAGEAIYALSWSH